MNWKKHGWKVLPILLLIYAVVAGLTIRVPDLPIVEESIRNLFYHVGMWFAMMVMFVISFVYSLRHLRTFSRKDDIMAHEAASVGLLFGLLGIFTGMIWAKNTWGAYWVKDPQLIGAAVSILAYMAYFVLRSSLDEVHKRARIAAVYNIFAFVMLTHSYGHSLRQNPSGHIYFIDVLTGALKQGYDIIICGRDDDPVTRRMLADAQKYYTPYSTIIFISDTNQRVLQTLAPYLENYHDLSGLPTGYLCRNRACEKPVTDPAEWAWLLNRNGSL